MTWRLRQEIAPLLPVERDAIAKSLRHFDSDRYKLEAFVVMDDHVHVLVTPLGANRLEDIVRSWKSFTGRTVRPGSDGLWQHEYFDRAVRHEVERLEKLRYIVKTRSEGGRRSQSILGSGHKRLAAVGRRPTATEASSRILRSS